MLDRDGNDWCSWCGDKMPPEREHLETCSNKCARTLASDLRRQKRETERAARKATMYAPRSDDGRCFVCGSKRPCECRLPVPPEPARQRCRYCYIRRTDGVHSMCERCLAHSRAQNARIRQMFGLTDKGRPWRRDC